MHKLLFSHSHHMWVNIIGIWPKISQVIEILLKIYLKTCKGVCPYVKKKKSVLRSYIPQTNPLNNCHRTWSLPISGTSTSHMINQVLCARVCISHWWQTFNCLHIIPFPFLLIKSKLLCNFFTTQFQKVSCAKGNARTVVWSFSFIPLTLVQTGCLKMEPSSWNN